MSRKTLAPRNFICECGKKKEGHYKWSDDENPEICECGKDMTEVSKEEINSPFIGKFASMTPAQRNEVLTKRSRNHFQKEIKDKKFEMNRELRRQAYGKKATSGRKD